MADFNVKENKFDYVRGYTIDLDLKTGLSKMEETSKGKVTENKMVVFREFAHEVGCSLIIKNERDF